MPNLKLFISRSKDLLIALGVALAILLVINFTFFSSSFYSKIFLPDSAAGQVTLMVNAEKTRPASPNLKTAIVFGDSRLAEGFSSKQASLVSRPEGLEIVNAAIPSTTPRCWFYFLSKIDPDQQKYDYVILGLPSLVKMTNEDLQERFLDLDYIAPIVKQSDIADVSGSFRTIDSQISAFRMLLMPGFVYKYDFQDLFVHPKDRWSKISNRYVSIGWSHNYDYLGRPETLAGVIWDEANKKAIFPKSYPNDKREFIETYIKSLSQVPNEKNKEYYVYWIQRLLQRYEKSGTKFIVFQVPAGPLPTTAPDAEAYAEIMDLSKRFKNLLIVPAGHFANLESPELFFDYLHLNSSGRQKLTNQLTELLLLEHKKTEKN